jgi:hypothetical protein
MSNLVSRDSGGRGALPKKPIKNRTKQKLPKLSVREAGTQRITKMANVITYGGLRPTEGILIEM